jgi:hypothetical protein
LGKKTEQAISRVIIDDKQLGSANHERSAYIYVALGVESRRKEAAAWGSSTARQRHKVHCRTAAAAAAAAAVAAAAAAAAVGDVRRILWQDQQNLKPEQPPC